MVPESATCRAVPAAPSPRLAHLQELVESCLSDDYTERPTFDDIVTRLDALLAEAEARSSAAPAPA